MFSTLNAVSGRSSNQALQKTKTGCVTCRTRRVKCDEAKPHCKRCINAGRRCEGYPLVVRETQIKQSWTASSRSPSPHSVGSKVETPSPERQLSLSTIGATDTEFHGYSFYRQSVSISLGGFMDVSFWHDLVLQVAETEPAIHHAVFAAGNLFRHTINTSQEGAHSTDPKGCRCQNCQNGLKSYNKAIASLTQRMSGSEEAQAHLIALLACVLFICMELFQGNESQALDLIQRGSDVLASCLRDSATTSGKSPRRFGSVDIRLIQIFTRLGLLSSLYGRPLRPSSIEDKSESKTEHVPRFHFTDLGEARSALYTLMDEAHLFLRHAGNVKWLPSSTQEELEECTRCKTRLEKTLNTWNLAFHLFLDDNSHEKAHIIAQLQAYHLVAQIWLATSLSLLQSSFDGHVDAFESILELAKSAIDVSPPDEAEAKPPQQQFAFEMGWIPLLYFTATKCRDLQKRTQAIALLEHACAREGLWSRQEAVVVARRVVELENLKTSLGGFVEEPREIKEERLFHDVVIGSPQLLGGRRHVNVRYFRRSGTSWEIEEENLEIQSGGAEYS